MSITALTAYVLVWPAVVAVILGVICVAFFTEYRSAKKKGREII